MTYISKTDYVLWRACPKNAWLRIHKPELYYSTELTEYEQSVVDMGIEVERVARNLFPHGVLVTGTPEAQQNTPNCLPSTPVGTLFQAVFQRDQLLAVIDVLQFDAETGWYSIHEIKSSTDVKEEHLYDLAFQVGLLRQHGMSADVMAQWIEFALMMHNRQMRFSIVRGQHHLVGLSVG